MTNLDWTKLGFGYRKTNTILTCYYRNGEWGPVESRTDDNLSINAFAGTLHYSIECFEGLKVYTQKNGMDADCIHPYHCFYFNACSRSAMMSSIFSIPTLKRIRSG